MPQYTYRCKSCEKQWEEIHSINEKPLVCPFCEIENIYRVPSLVSTVVKAEDKKAKTGEVVKDYIEQNKEVLKELKQEIKRQKL